MRRASPDARAGARGPAREDTRAEPEEPRTRRREGPDGDARPRASRTPGRGGAGGPPSAEPVTGPAPQRAAKRGEAVCDLLLVEVVPNYKLISYGVQEYCPYGLFLESREYGFI